MMRGMGLTAILDLTEGRLDNMSAHLSLFGQDLSAWKKTFLGQTTDYTVESEALK